MRPLRVIVLVLALLAPALLLLGGSPAQAQGIAAYRFLPAQVFGSVAVGMPDERTVQVQHLDPATQAWDAPTTVHRTRGAVSCGAIHGRASGPSGPGVVLVVECDKPFYEDQAPVHSVALVSRDGFTWSHETLPGEAYRAPAISPSATYAAWLVGANGEYVEWSATSGFGEPARTSYRYDQGLETPVVDDAGTVTVIGPESSGRRCVVGIHARTLAGAKSHTTLPVDPGCTEGDFENVDALTVRGGGLERATQITIARASVGAPWAVTRPAPVDAPGLVRYGYTRKRIPTHFLYSTTPGSPIVAVGSPDRHQVVAQLFDETSWSWRPQVRLYAGARRCQDGYEPLPETSLYVDTLRCGSAYVVLASPDAATWTVRDVGRRPFTVTAEGATLPGDSGTTVVSGSAVEEFPGTTEGPCDVEQAGRPGELLRLHGARHGWPTKVQVSTGGAFRTVSHAHRFRDPCREVLVLEGGGFGFNGRHQAHDGQFELHGDTWRFVWGVGDAPYLRADS